MANLAGTVSFEFSQAVYIKIMPSKRCCVVPSSYIEDIEGDNFVQLNPRRSHAIKRLLLAMSSNEMNTKEPIKKLFLNQAVRGPR